MQPPTVLLLDALGTLLEMERPAPRLRQALERTLGISVSEQEVADAVVHEIGYYRQHQLEGADASSLHDLRLRCAEVVRDNLPAAGQLEPEQLLPSLIESIHFVPYPDALVALGGLRSRFKQIVVVSNWDVSLHDLIAASELAPYIDGVVASAEVGELKPGPAPFIKGLAMAGATAEQAVFVGDDPVADISGAEAVGIRAVLVDRYQMHTGFSGRSIGSLTQLTAELA